MQYTVFQLKDELKRFQKKMAFDMYLKARLAGAKDLDEVDNWMDEKYLVKSLESYGKTYFQ